MMIVDGGMGNFGGPGGGFRRRQQNVFNGVPPEIIATFPAFKFEAATFVKREEAGDDGSSSDGGVISSRVHDDESAAADGRHHQGNADGAAHTRPPESSGTSSAADEVPQCSVCIGDFEEGEMLRRLPCLHVYHQSCIDQWMTQHNTCPNCRWALYSPPPQPADGAETSAFGGWGRNNRIIPVPEVIQVSPGPPSEGEASAASPGGAPLDGSASGPRRPAAFNVDVMAPTPFIGRAVTHRSVTEPTQATPVPTLARLSNT